MSAGTSIAEAHKLAGKACGKLSVMLATEKLKISVIAQAVQEMEQALAILKPLLEASKPSPK